ncbi:MAG: formylglycine-generating enzyme family protein [Prochlorotrichaceae cyanobacterium]
MVASKTRDITDRRVQVFEQRYGRQATHLAAHAAFPLTLTTDVVYCLRETFLPDCPWYAAADVLLSNLCNPVGYDLYEMEAATRRYLLRYLRDQFGDSRVNRLEEFMVAYLRYRLAVEPGSDRALSLGEKPEWTTLACLRPGEAYEEIRRVLQELALAENGLAKSERFRLAGLVESYGDFLADQGFQPFLLDMADRVAEGEPIDDTADLALKLKEAGFAVGMVDFEVATVVFGLAETPPDPETLQSAIVETVTVDAQGQEVQRQSHRVFYFEEDLPGLPEEAVPLRMAAIPSGEFLMGSPKNEEGRYEDENPQHRVWVEPFFIGQFPVTQAQWRVVAGLPQQERELKTDPARFKGANNPVEQVSWDDAVEFCARLSELTGRRYRLPSEAEWEYACRAETTTPFYFGETITTDLANYNGKTPYAQAPKGEYRQKTTLVGQFPPNAFGLYDMHGNVWEYCQDYWHGNYDKKPEELKQQGNTAWLSSDESKYHSSAAVPGTTIHVIAVLRIATTTSSTTSTTVFELCARFEGSSIPLLFYPLTLLAPLLGGAGGWVSCPLGARFKI